MRQLVCAVFILIQLIEFNYGEFTPQEVQALNKFKEVVNKDLLYRDFMKTDEYLLSWLKARNYDINAAAEMLSNSVKWRKANKMDSIIEESSVNCDGLFSYDVDSVDKEGRTVSTVILGTWDVRKIALAGKSDQFVRCMLRYLEIVTTKARERYNQSVVKKGLPQFVFVVDLKGYNLRQHGCLACIPAYVNAIRQYEANFPGAVHSFYLLNTPSYFEALLEVAKTAFTQSSRDAINVFGYDKDTWKAALLKVIPEDQLTPTFGGTKKNG